MSPTQADVLDTINAAPAGLTARQIADFVGSDVNSIFGKLCRLYTGGQIMKRPGNPVLWKPLP